MAVKVTQRNPVGKHVAFRDIVVGTMFTFVDESDCLMIKTELHAALKVKDILEGNENSMQMIDGDCQCLMVDVNIEWCVAGSI